MSLSGLDNWWYSCNSVAFEKAAVNLIPWVSRSVLSLFIVQLAGLSMSYDCCRLRFAEEDILSSTNNPHYVTDKINCYFT